MTIQRVTGACLALSEGIYTNRHSTVANIVHQELAIKCGLSKIPPMLYHTYEPHSVAPIYDTALEVSVRPIITALI